MIVRYGLMIFLFLKKLSIICASRTDMEHLHTIILMKYSYGVSWSICISYYRIVLLCLQKRKCERNLSIMVKYVYIVLMCFLIELYICCIPFAIEKLY